MNKELEEAIKTVRKFNQENRYRDCGKINNSIDMVLQALENSIPKEVIEKYLKEEQEHFEIYKKESKTNENLKMGMWKHLGAKNMCERILGIDKNIITLDKLLGGK